MRENRPSGLMRGGSLLAAYALAGSFLLYIRGSGSIFAANSPVRFRPPAFASRFNRIVSPPNGQPALRWKPFFASLNLLPTSNYRIFTIFLKIF